MRIVLAFLLFVYAGSAFAGPTTQSPLEVDGSTTISASEAYELYLAGAMFIDARAAADFEAGRIPEAHRMHTLSPDFTQKALNAVVSDDQPVVFYCNGKHCPLSSVGAKKAVSWGYQKVYYFRDGYPAWETAGLPIE